MTVASAAAKAAVRAAYDRATGKGNKPIALKSYVNAGGSSSGRPTMPRITGGANPRNSKKGRGGNNLGRDEKGRTAAERASSRQSGI